MIQTVSSNSAFKDFSVAITSRNAYAFIDLGPNPRYAYLSNFANCCSATSSSVYRLSHTAMQKISYSTNAGLPGQNCRQIVFSNYACLRYFKYKTLSRSIKHGFSYAGQDYVWKQRRRRWRRLQQQQQRGRTQMRIQKPCYSCSETFDLIFSQNTMIASLVRESTGWKLHVEDNHDNIVMFWELVEVVVATAAGLIRTRQLADEQHDLHMKLPAKWYSLSMFGYKLSFNLMSWELIAQELQSALSKSCG
ncbi:hypothetical protein V1514DRAFT_319739 [Lipomyces japonicus]|uniref:uncharacterized protein n=1 Tax=Lipomyces japonicus TaxID=56871 RepID=UPI0034CDDCE2